TTTTASATTAAATATGPAAAPAAAATARPAAATARPAAAATRTAAATPPVAAAGAGRRGGEGRRFQLREVLAAVALGHDLALVDPALDADAAERRARLVEAVFDVRPQRVQRDAAVGIPL